MRLGYDDIKRINEETKVIILSNENNTERFLFFNDPFNTRHNPTIRRQTKINGIWRYMQNLTGNDLAIQFGGINTTKEKGNLKYLELQDKGFNKKVVTTLANI